MVIAAEWPSLDWSGAGNWSEMLGQTLTFSALASVSSLNGFVVTSQ